MESSPVPLRSVPLSLVVGIHCRVTNCPQAEWFKGTTYRLQFCSMGWALPARGLSRVGWQGGAGWWLGAQLEGVAGAHGPLHVATWVSSQHVG